MGGPQGQALRGLPRRGINLQCRGLLAASHSPQPVFALVRVPVGQCPAYRPLSTCWHREQRSPFTARNNSAAPTDSPGRTWLCSTLLDTTPTAVSFRARRIVTGDDRSASRRHLNEPRAFSQETAAPPHGGAVFVMPPTPTRAAAPPPNSTTDEPTPITSHQPTPPPTTPIQDPNPTPTQEQTQLTDPNRTPHDNSNPSPSHELSRDTLLSSASGTQALFRE